jgi:hypothetical protein
MLYLAGRKFDKNGKLQQWWSQTSINNFVSESQCVEYQYGNYSVKEANMKVCISTIAIIKVYIHKTFEWKRICAGLLCLYQVRKVSTHVCEVYDSAFVSMIFLLHFTIYLMVLHFIYNISILCANWRYQRFDFWFDFLCFNATFSNISAISWRPVLVVEEVGVPGENHRPWASNR